MGESDDEDDYMSDKFIAGLEEKRPTPGLVVSRSVSRIYKQEATHKQINHLRKTQSAKNLQIVQRETALQTHIPKENKGFALLQKMGYEPGMGMGKKEQGRTEPVPIQLKVGRHGLGQETHAKRKLLQHVHLKEKVRRKVTGDFRVTNKNRFRDKEMRHDLYASQKVCEQLDSAKGVAEPREKFFWPELLLPDHMKPSCSALKSDFDDEHEEERPDPGIFRKRADLYEDGEEEVDDEVEEEDEWPLEDKLDMITTYLRSHYFYCVWCGTNYNDKDDLTNNCPGPSNSDHKS